MEYNSLLITIKELLFMIKIGNLNLDTEFDYRIIREEDNDIDLFIDKKERRFCFICKEEPK